MIGSGLDPSKEPNNWYQVLHPVVSDGVSSEARDTSFVQDAEKEQDDNASSLSENESDAGYEINCYCLQKCSIRYVTLWRQWLFTCATIERHYSEGHKVVEIAVFNG